MIYLRPLKIEDAETSWKWRNDPEIWKHTGSRPSSIITPDIEKEWIAKVIRRDNEKRFAICVQENDLYIGNVQLTDICNGEAQYHIFIGEKSYWGKGCAKEATLKILQIGFKVLHLAKIYLEANTDNVKAVTMYRKCGFIGESFTSNGNLYLEMNRSEFNEKA